LLSFRFASRPNASANARSSLTVQVDVDRRYIKAVPPYLAQGLRKIGNRTYDVGSMIAQGLFEVIGE
jgi:hypothetical protein